MSTLNIGSDGMGSWGFNILDPLIQRAFPHSIITHDTSRPYDLVIRSHFARLETTKFTCPYITWSGEAYRAPLLPDRKPLFELDTVLRPHVENSVYFPHLVAEIAHTERPVSIGSKKWCAAYAFSNRVRQREELFQALRAREPTCYAFGPSCKTHDNPFELARSHRESNGTMFGDFGFVVAMENCVAPGYVTEKIGHAFNAGSVPIYWGDGNAVSDLFNPAAFVNVGDYGSPTKAAETVIEIWRDKQKLRRYLDVPIVLNDRLRDFEAIRTEYRPWQKLAIDRLRETFPDRS